mgnify:CR=1 FL=1
MCGIVGYKGKQQPKEFLIEGLKNLEYRGYDSSGIALKNDDSIQIILGEVCTGKNIDIVLGVELMGIHSGDNQLSFFCRLQRSGDHPVHGEEHNQGNQNDHNGLNMITCGMLLTGIIQSNHRYECPLLP